MEGSAFAPNAPPPADMPQANRLSRLNENVLSPNRFEQFTVEDDTKESANIGKYDDNSNNNSTRTTTK